MRNFLYCFLKMKGQLLHYLITVTLSFSVFRNSAHVTHRNPNSKVKIMLKEYLQIVLSTFTYKGKSCTPSSSDCKFCSGKR
jgi:hypothetical protein